MQKINLNKLVKDVIKLAKENPHNVYNPVKSACYYSKGECENGSVGCLIGQALKQQKFKFNQYNNNLPISILLSNNNINCGKDKIYKKVNWLKEVQACQDRGVSWAKAIQISQKDF